MFLHRGNQGQIVAWDNNSRKDMACNSSTMGVEGNQGHSFIHSARDDSKTI